jgi:hypothetical protein
MKSPFISLFKFFSKANFRELMKLRRRTTFLNQRYRIDYAVCYLDAQINSRKLTPKEEASLVQWILSMDKQGIPPKIAYTRRMANLLLSERGKDFVGENWVQKFVRRHDEIKAKYCCKYDYQRAKCENSQAIQEWFDRVSVLKQKYGILDEDIYNF